MADYAVWNNVTRALAVLEEAETVSIETYREAANCLREAITALLHKGKKV